MGADWLHDALALPLGYLLGSIPFGLLLTRLAGAEDIRQIGSGNIGATNVLRTGRKGLAAATLVGDALKGTVAVLIASGLWGHEPALAAGLGAILGHVFPVWLRFRGGKGVATYIGVLLGLAPLGAVAFAVTWLIVALATRYSSLSALTATIVAPLFLWLHGDGPVAALFAVLSVLIFIMHRENIRRLIAGREGKIGASKASQAPHP